MKRLINKTTRAEYCCGLLFMYTKVCYLLEARLRDYENYSRPHDILASSTAYRKLERLGKDLVKNKEGEE